MRTLVLALAVTLAAAAASAEPVQIRDGARRLNGNLERAVGKPLSEGVAIVLHGTLSHHGHETIVALQKNLAARGVATLAVTLSLGIDDRRGQRPCDVLHAHTQADIAREVAGWQAWAVTQGARTIDHIGFSRGGAELATLMQPPGSGRKVVLLAPALLTPADMAIGYRKTFSRELGPALDAARTAPAQVQQADFLYCRAAPVTGASFLDAYREVPASAVATIAQPTLVVIAGNDEIVPGLADRLPAAVRRVVIEGSDHFFRDLYGEDAADAVAAFLREP